ncbi:MAG: 2Fe-2S iron-sulfur cluster binding domain-containing protein [Polynucleobacter sp.]|jgi:ferredoxin-NADP reductase|nr:2Fe-2S iron-sulfur cluster binding domain-containing protein [Polynucleobacter sp.]
METNPLDHSIIEENKFWGETFFPERHAKSSRKRRKQDLTEPQTISAKIQAEYWMKCLFAGVPLDRDPCDKIIVMQNGLAIHEIALDRLNTETLVGRHPNTDLQLESNKMGMYHLALVKSGGKLYMRSLDDEVGVLLDRKKVGTQAPIPLWNGAFIDLPGYRLEFVLSEATKPETLEGMALEEIAEIPRFFYTPPIPPASPVLANLIDNRSTISLWSEGQTIVKVVDILDETPDTKTFRFAGEEPLLFSYRPGQFITFILEIDGKQVKRSYSMSSSPSRPHLLDVTIKRVPGGLVSNWFCDQVKLGQRLTIKGPSGKFSCFEYPSSKMLFIGAGSGITPILSMSRWISDTSADVHVKLLASFKSPEDIIFRKELEHLASRSQRFHVAVTLTADLPDPNAWDGLRGRVGPDMLRKFAPDLDERDVFICGPKPFFEAVRQTLQELEFDLSRLHTESFDSGRVAHGSGGLTKALELSGPTHEIKFVRSGITVQTDENITLLELAEAHGIQIDYSCRVGSCGECEMKCAGEVKIDSECTIDAKSKAAGFVYSCSTRASGNLEVQA